MAQSIDTLTTRFEADIQKFESAMKKMTSTHDAAMKKIEEQHGGALGRIGSAAEEAFGAIGSKVKNMAFEEGAKQIGVFGSALEALGPVGLAAAGALAAFGISMEQAEQAMKWADELQRQADMLGTTTVKLQEMRYAADGLSVSQETMEEGLKSLSVAMGAYQSNVKDKRVATVFETLGISKDDARQWQDPIDALDAISKKLETAGSAAEKANLLKALKLPPDMITALSEGGEALARMREEAHKVGAIMDAETVKKAAELNDKLEQTNRVISIQLKEAFIGLAPDVLKIANWMADIAKSSNTWLQNMLHGRTGIHGFDPSAMSEDTIEKNANEGFKQVRAKRDYLTSQGVKFDAHGNVDQSSLSDYYKKDPNADIADYTNTLQEYRAYIGEWAKRINADKKPAEGNAPAKALAPEKPKADDTAKFDAAADEALQNAKKAAADAYRALASTIDQKASDETDAVIADTNAKLVKLNKDETDIRKSTIDAHAKRQLAEIDEARSLLADAEAAKLSLIERTRLVDHMKAEADAYQQDAQIREEQLKHSETLTTMRAGLATTTAQRNEYELQALKIAQQIDADMAQAKVDYTKRLLDQVTLLGNPDEIAKAQKNYGQAVDDQKYLSDYQKLQNQQFNKQHENPGQRYLDQLNDTTDDFTNVEVKGLQGFNDGIVEAIGHTKTLGQAFHDVALSIVTDLERIAVQRLVTQPLANMLFGGGGASGGGGGIFATIGHLFGHAAGTDYSPGGLGVVGENGPELVAFGQGTQVLPNNLLRNAMSAPQGSMTRGGDIHYNVSVDARNAATVNEIKAYINQAMVLTGQATKSATMQEMQSKSRRSFLR